MSEGIAEGADKKYTIKKSYTMSKAGVEKSVWHIMDGDFVVDVTDLRRDAKYYADKWNAAEKESSNASQNQHKQDVTEGLFDRFKKKLTANRGGIDLTASKEGGRIIINASSQGKQLGIVMFNINGKTLVADRLMVQPEYRGQGIAEIMYDWAKGLGYTVQRSSDQTDDGKRFWDKLKGEETNVWEQDVAESLDEAVGDNYLYHATQPSGMMRILRSGAIKASYRSQEATKARTQLPTVSTTRSKQYAESDDFVDFLNLTKEGNSVIIVFDSNAVANHYKMFSTSQGTQTVGDEFEEVIVVPKGMMPIQGTMKGFYFNPKRTLEIEEFKDTPWFKELLNSPYYMGQKQGVAEKLGDNRPELGSKRDAGKSVRKWRSERGLDEVDAQNFVGGMTASYQARENQPIAEGCVVDYMEEVRS
jgi:GNAT superfamily N-acetyltransferase